MVARIGKAAPEFAGQAVLPGGEIAEIKLSDYLNKGWCAARERVAFAARDDLLCGPMTSSNPYAI